MMGTKSVKIICDGTVQNLGQILGETAQFAWGQFLAGDPGAAVFIGGEDCDTQGFPLASGAGQLYPRNTGEIFNLYLAPKVFFVGATDDVLYFLYPVG